MNFSGMQIQVIPDIPKMKLAPGDYVTPAFRAEMDAWLLQFFGTTNLAADGECFVIGGGKSAVMNPRTFARLKGITG